MYNTLDREYFNREAIKSELIDTPRIEQIHKVLTAYIDFPKGKARKMFKVDGQPTKAFKEVLKPLNLSIKSSVINYMQIRAGYDSLELHIRASDCVEGEYGTSYTEHIIYLGKFSCVNYRYDINSIELNSVHDIKVQLENYNPMELEEIKAKLTERKKLLEAVKAVEDTMPYYSYR